jgi:cytoskeletal protein CcmA (bactofilin family)
LKYLRNFSAKAMFGSNDNNKDSRRSQTGSNATAGAYSNNSLVNGTRIEGTIFTESDIRIDGQVTGTVHSKGKIIIGSTGQIHGEIQCKNAVIEGKFSGILVCTELLQVKETAVIEGDVSTAKLLVQAGATFNVTCRMGAQRMKELKREEPVPMELGQLSRVANQ